MDDKELFYNQIATDFDEIMNMYDTNRRIEIIFDVFLKDENLKAKTLLDAGCGTGWFTKRAAEREAVVTSVDLAPNLVEITAQKVPMSKTLVASILDLPFEDNTFDYVVSSDVIEHTPDPYKAVLELIRVLKPGGKLAITVPNRSFWYFSVLIANLLKLRDYQGYENWVHYYGLKKFLQQNNTQIIQYRGLHLVPFFLGKFNRIIKKADEATKSFLSPMMINIAAYVEKK